MATNNSTSNSPRRSAFSVAMGRSGSTIAIALLLFTALIWLRLRLVTDVPRQAYAEPKPQVRQLANPTNEQDADREAERVLGRDGVASPDEG